MPNNKRPHALPSLNRIRADFEALCTEPLDPGRVLVVAEQLQEDLEVALDAFVSKDKLTGQILSLWTFHKFLVELGINTRLRAPLCSIIADLTDGDRRGAEKPLLDFSALALAAAALDTLIRAGIKQQIAAKKIAEISDQGFGADQLITFRENLQRGRARSEAVEIYADMLKSIKERYEHLDKEERIRETLLSVYGNIVPSKKP